VAGGEEGGRAMALAEAVHAAIVTGRVVAV